MILPIQSLVIRRSSYVFCTTFPYPLIIGTVYQEVVPERLDAMSKMCKYPPNTFFTIPRRCSQSWKDPVLPATRCLCLLHQSLDALHYPTRINSLARLPFLPQLHGSRRSASARGERELQAVSFLLAHLSAFRERRVLAPHVGREVIPVGYLVFHMRINHVADNISVAWKAAVLRS